MRTAGAPDSRRATSAVEIGGTRDGGRPARVDGLRAVRSAGGWVLAQDQSTSVVFGMPRRAIEPIPGQEYLVPLLLLEQTSDLFYLLRSRWRSDYPR